MVARTLKSVKYTVTPYRPRAMVRNRLQQDMRERPGSGFMRGDNGGKKRRDNLIGSATTRGATLACRGEDADNERALKRITLRISRQSGFHRKLEEIKRNASALFGPPQHTLEVRSFPERMAKFCSKNRRRFFPEFPEERPHVGIICSAPDNQEKTIRKERICIDIKPVRPAGFTQHIEHSDHPVSCRKNTAGHRDR